MNQQPSAAVSAVIITKNEEKNIAECIESLAWADEIVVVDSGSDDRTVEIAKGYTDQVYVKTWEGQGMQKNYAVDLARGPWIFSIDADERVSREAAEEIQRIVRNPEFKIYAMRRKNYYRGQWIRFAGWWPDWVKRLFIKGEARFNDLVIHESLQSARPAGRLSNPLHHYSFHSVDEFIERAHRYSTHAARAQYRAGKRATLWTAVSHSMFTLFQTYILRLGILEGAAGVLIAASQSVGVFYRYMLIRELSLDGKDPGVDEQ